MSKNVAQKLIESHLLDGRMEPGEEIHLGLLIRAGARLHQAGCNGCIGMGQAPATEKLSLRTVPRNFPGRSGTREDRVCLVSPETATASALEGVITDPRSLSMDCPRFREPEDLIINTDMLQAPLSPEQGRGVNLVKGPNVASLPRLEPLPDQLELPVLLKLGDDISTDEILPAGTRVLPFRSNIPKISEFCFESVGDSYHERAMKVRDEGGHAVVAGSNYGQRSSREHAALAPRYLGLRLALARSFARIHWENLVNFGVVPLVFDDGTAYEWIEQGNVLRIEDVREQLRRGTSVEVLQDSRAIPAHHSLSKRQVEILLEGGLINWAKNSANR